MWCSVCVVRVWQWNPWLEEKTPFAPPFFFYEWNIIQKLYNTTVVNMHTPTYIRTYIHTHALDNSFLFWRRAQLTFSPRLIICTHGKSLPYLLISHGSLSLHLYIARIFLSLRFLNASLFFFFFSSVPTFEPAFYVKDWRCSLLTGDYYFIYIICIYIYIFVCMYIYIYCMYT